MARQGKGRQTTCGAALWSWRGLGLRSTTHPLHCRSFNCEVVLGTGLLDSVRASVSCCHFVHAKIALFIICRAGRPPLNWKVGSTLHAVYLSVDCGTE